MPGTGMEIQVLTGAGGKGRQGGELGMVCDASTVTLGAWDQPVLVWLWDLSTAPSHFIPHPVTSRQKHLLQLPGQDSNPVPAPRGWGRGDGKNMWAEQRRSGGRSRWARLGLGQSWCPHQCPGMPTGSKRNGTGSRRLLGVLPWAQALPHWQSCSSCFAPTAFPCV